MDTIIEKYSFILFILKEHSKNDDINIVIINTIIDIPSNLYIMINNEMISFKFNLCKSKLPELKDHILSFNTKIYTSSIYAQYYNLDKHSRKERNSINGYVALPNNDKYLMYYLDDDHFLSL